MLDQMQRNRTRSSAELRAEDTIEIPCAHYSGHDHLPAIVHDVECLCKGMAEVQAEFRFVWSSCSKTISIVQDNLNPELRTVVFQLRAQSSQGPVLPSAISGHVPFTSDIMNKKINKQVLSVSV
jgi:hypothetical protein